MSAITRTVHLYAQAPRYGKEIRFWVSESTALPMESFGRIVASAEITFTVPDDMNVVAMAIEELEAEKVKAAEDFRRTMAGINERLQKLQAIEGAAQEVEA